MLNLEGITRYFGPVVAVDNVSLSVGKGDILGFLGPNGAGKSTTMKMIAGFLSPTRGTARVCGLDVAGGTVDVKKQLGLSSRWYPCLRRYDCPRGSWSSSVPYAGSMARNDPGRLVKQLNGLFSLTVADNGLNHCPRVSSAVPGLPRPFCMIPRYLILDESTDGLNPVQKHHMREMIATMSGDKAIIISTHILEEVAAVFNRVAVLAGKSWYSGS